jgi:long-chain acyl-CoA synthetase
MSLLINHLLNQPDPGYPILIEEESRWTLTELKQKVAHLASALQTRGVQPGDRVASMFMNQKEALLSFFAILAAGAVVVPINITLPPEDIIHVILNSGSRLVLTTAAFAQKFEGRPIPVLVSNQSIRQEGGFQFPSLEEAMQESAESLNTSDFASVEYGDENTMRILMYTSGTTGRPKGVMLSERNLLSNLEGFAPVVNIEPQDQLLLALPIFHAYGQMIALYALQRQAPLYLVPNFAPKKIMQTLVEHHITILPLVPTMFSVLLGSIQKIGPDKLSSLKACVSGGASLPEKLLQQIESTLNLVVLEGYGLTECSPVLAVNSRERGSIPKSVGKALPNVNLKLVDEQGNTIPWQPGQVSGEGEILAKGPNIMLGYYNLPEDTELAFDPEGYFRTGDLGHLDPEGNLFISGGRKKDLIIKAGENIAPIRIEEVLHHHPAILHAAVIGIPDEKLGEEILACVELKPGESVTEAELKRFCLEHLTPLMVPALVRICSELPKNQTGKVLKNQLKAEYGQKLQKNGAPA